MVNDTTDQVGTASPLEKALNENETLSFNEIRVTLTFEDFPSWIFRFARQTSADVKKLKQQYLDLKEKERETGAKEYRLKSLSMLLVADPENVYGYNANGDMRESFYNYFSREENEEYLHWIWNEYQTKLYPKEFTSRLLE